MNGGEYQTIIDQRLENWQLTEEQFVESWLFFLHTDFFGLQPRYVHPFLYGLGRDIGKTKDEMWADYEAARRSELQAAYHMIMREHDVCSPPVPVQGVLL